MDNPLDELREIINNQKPDSLYKLSFSGKNLEQIPPEIYNIINLKELDLSENAIKKIPPEIVNLTNLEKLI